MGSIENMGGGGPVEADETMIGGLARFMYKDKKAEKITGTGDAKRFDLVVRGTFGKRLMSSEPTGKTSGSTAIC